LVEVAIAFPLLALLLFGLIEFGIFINHNISESHGVREGARQAVVANYSGNDAACTGTPNAEILCFTKDRIAADMTAVRVLIPNGVAVGNELAVCASTPTASITGLMQAFLPKFGHAEAKMRIEELPPQGQTLLAGGDPALAGDDWSWCTP
jgi:TadE-like protein